MIGKQLWVGLDCRQSTAWRLERRFITADLLPSMSGRSRRQFFSLTARIIAARWELTESREVETLSVASRAEALLRLWLIRVIRRASRLSQSLWRSVLQGKTVFTRKAHTGFLRICSQNGSMKEVTSRRLCAMRL